MSIAMSIWKNIQFLILINFWKWRNIFFIFENSFDIAIDIDIAIDLLHLQKI